jgi:TetR/AcrR family transcriptional regulator, fatty acid metabolism regulator protein
VSARATAQEEKRQRILDAAVVVFARAGYHTSRVGDIAEEAGVAHGLLYHYFPSKEAVLHAIFQDNWAQLVGRFRTIAASDEVAADKLSGLAKIVLRTWRNDPALVTVMVREIARSPQLQARVSEITEGLEVIQAVISGGQATGEFRPDTDARLAAWMFYGALEETLTGWVLGQLPDGEEEVARAERTVVDIICSGLVTGTSGR